MSIEEMHRFCSRNSTMASSKANEEIIGRDWKTFFFDRVLFVIVPVVDLIRRNSLKFTRNSTRKEMLPATASKTDDSSRKNHP